MKNQVSKYSIAVATSTLCLFLTMPTQASSTNNWWLDGVSYTQRTDWGADEKRRLASRAEYQKILEAAKQFEGTEEDEPTAAETQRKTATDYVLQFFAWEFKIDRVVRWKWNNKLRWSNQYRIKKTKILVHHTADNNKSLPDTIAKEKEYMKNLYRYHAFSRGRGDIGYNFIVMPSGRIYEWRAWGAWVVWAHATWNNTPSVWISLVGNFEEKNPTQVQINALLDLTTSLSKKYNINPTEERTYFKKSSSFPFIAAVKNQAIAWHSDAGQTACPGENLYALLPDIRKATSQRLAGNKASIVVGAWVIAESKYNTEPVVMQPQPQVSVAQNTSSMQQKKQQYIAEKWFTSSKASIKRLDKAPLVSTIPTVTKKPVSVLLYEASVWLDSWSIVCSRSCTVRINGARRIATALEVTKSNNAFAVKIGNRTFTSSRFAISVWDEWTIQIKNFDRYASNKTPLNVFRQSLLFVYWPVKKINEQPASIHHIINIVSLDNYMKWIAEASDNQTQTKANVLALLSKAYALYYMGWLVKHPSIPEWALYNSVDDPRIFQKYLWSWWEKISTKRPIALRETAGKYIAYNNTLPILPYFNCSAWFTRSAQEKWWRTDTPYLRSVEDVTSAACSDFNGHGVGLSWEWASKLADQWKSAKEILEYYYPWIEIVTK